MKLKAEKGKNRLDKFISEKLEDLSRSFIIKLIKEGKVLVNKQIKSPGYVIKENELIEINLKPEKREIKPGNIQDLKSYFEDDEIIVIEKPAGLLVHPVTGKEPETVVSLLEEKVKIKDSERPGIVHRIDKDTSGLLIVAKTKKSEENLKEQFKKRKVEKGYIALVYGNLKPKKGEISIPLDRSTKERVKRVVKSGGKEALTRYEVLEYIEHKGQEYTLVDVSILTGRTHQIRVHFEAIGHPLAGDKEYGNKKYQSLSKKLNFKRQFLHAYRIVFFHPVSKKEMSFRSNLPEDLNEVLKDLKK